MNYEAALMLEVRYLPGVYLFVQSHVAVPVHLVHGVGAAGSLAGAQLHVNIHLIQEQKVINIKINTNINQ